MQWVAILLYAYCVSLGEGQEAKSALVTLPQLPTLKTVLAKSNVANVTSVNSLRSKTTAANTSSLGDVLARAGLAKPTDLMSTSLLPTTDAKTNAVGFKVPCTCGVFLSGQFVAGSGQQPEGVPPLLQEYDTPMPCTPVGQRQCANKCLEVIARHLRNSATIICGSLDRDCFKERAYLWTKNCNDVWENSHMSAGREFCCKDGLPYKCPIGKI